MGTVKRPAWMLCVCGAPSTKCGPFGNVCDECHTKLCAVREESRDQHAIMLQKEMDELRAGYETEVAAAEEQRKVGIEVVAGIYQQINEKFPHIAAQMSERWELCDNLRKGLSTEQSQRLIIQMCAAEVDFYATEVGRKKSEVAVVERSMHEMTKQHEELKQKLTTASSLLRELENVKRVPQGLRSSEKQAAKQSSRDELIAELRNQIPSNEIFNRQDMMRVAGKLGLLKSMLDIAVASQFTDEQFRNMIANWACTNGKILTHKAMPDTAKIYSLDPAAWLDASIKSPLPVPAGYEVRMGAMIDFGPSEPPVFGQMPPAPGYNAVIAGVDMGLGTERDHTAATITAVDKDAGKITVESDHEMQERLAALDKAAKEASEKICVDIAKDTKP